MKESEIRDFLAKNIEKLKKGLILLQKEQFIPNQLGTRSFIDLYAKDTKGHHVLIELKRSDASTREALHEVTKYVEGVKRHLGVKENEIHVIIASTKWNELIVPFSHFVLNSSFSIEGLKIFINENESDFLVEAVECVPITEGRFIAPWHNVFWYSDKQSLEAGIDSIKSSYYEKGIENYLIVVLTIEYHMSAEELKAEMRTKVAQLVRVDEAELSDDSLFEIPMHKYIAYTALQIMSKERCLQILQINEEENEEVQELLPNMEKEEALCYLHETVESTEPRPQCNFYEIGYPAKFAMLLDSGECKLCKIERSGIFSRNTLLSDETILSELRGEDGATGQKFKRKVRVEDRAHMTTLKKDISQILEENSVWKNQIIRIIDDITIEFPNADLDIYIFNPCTGIFTLYFMSAKEDGLLYIPSYHIIVNNPHPTRMYFGALKENSEALTFPEILQKYYEGNLEMLLLSMTWGCKDSRDSDIVEDLGLAYRSFYCDIDGNDRTFFILQNEKWRVCEPVNPISLFVDYLNKNEQLVQQVITKIGPRDLGGLCDASPSTSALDEIADVELGMKKNEYYLDPSDECDLCRCSLENEKYMIDGSIKNSGGWAFMCSDCFQVFGNGIAWGQGQLYLRNDKGWLLVGGFAEDAFDT